MKKTAALATWLTAKFAAFQISDARTAPEWSAAAGPSVRFGADDPGDEGGVDDGSAMSDLKRPFSNRRAPHRNGTADLLGLAAA
jgi:hypothetical protein